MWILASLFLEHSVYVKVPNGDVWPAGDGRSCLLSTGRDISEGGAATKRRRGTATFVYSSLLHHRHCFRDIWYGQIIALSLFTLWWRVARSANSMRCEARPCARSLQWNAVSVVQQVSRRYIEADNVLFIPRSAVAYVNSLTDSCTLWRRDEEVRKTFAFL